MQTGSSRKERCCVMCYEKWSYGYSYDLIWLDCVLGLVLAIETTLHGLDEGAVSDRSANDITKWNEMKVLARARGSGGVWPRAVFGPVDKFGIFTPPWFMISLDSCRVRLAYECSVDVLGTCRKGTRLMQTKKNKKKKQKNLKWAGMEEVGDFGNCGLFTSCLYFIHPFLASTFCYTLCFFFWFLAASQ
jgi:hypothetical protein